MSAHPHALAQVALFEELAKGVRRDLRAMGTIEGDPALRALLTKQERDDYMTSVGRGARESACSVY